MNGEIATYKYEQQKRQNKYKLKENKSSQKYQYSLTTPRVLTGIDSPFFQTQMANSINLKLYNISIPMQVKSVV